MKDRGEEFRCGEISFGSLPAYQGISHTAANRCKYRMSGLRGQMWSHLRISLLSSLLVKASVRFTDVQSQPEAVPIFKDTSRGSLSIEEKRLRGQRCRCFASLGHVHWQDMNDTAKSCSMNQDERQKISESPPHENIPVFRATCRVCSGAQIGRIEVSAHLPHVKSPIDRLSE